MSAPYLADTASLLPYTLGQIVTVEAFHPSLPAPIPLELQSGQIGWDEERAPRCIATVVIHCPEDQATLDALDPRTGVRLRIRAGYVRPDGVDVQPVADLLLTRRQVQRPANLVTLTAQGEEIGVLSNRPPASYTSSTDVSTSVIDGLTRALGRAPTIVENTLPATSMVAAPVLETQDYWTQIDDWCDRSEADVWDDGLRQWHLTSRPVLSTPRAALNVGAAGVLTNTDTTLDRQGWFNAVQIRYTWQTVRYELVTHEKDGRIYRETQENASALSIADAQLNADKAQLQDAISRGSASAEAVARTRVAQSQAARDAASNTFNASFDAYNASGTSLLAITEDHSLVGTAVAQGAYGPAVAGGRVTYSEEREAATTQAAADVAAGVLLSRFLARGRTLELEGIAHWWLRPGHTVSAQLVTGGAELCLAGAVTFNLTSGRMQVRTRRPDTETTIVRGG